MPPPHFLPHLKRRRQRDLPSLPSSPENPPHQSPNINRPLEQVLLFKIQLVLLFKKDPPVDQPDRHRENLLAGEQPDRPLESVPDGM
mmetsp:Transcript_1771/g.2702  ORF Transcript_1771/g.2702 Transcript_1771/m.2702 type:complete len:87 (-) Transcript_1771:252-512(-)